jgi:hypothetical protein
MALFARIIRSISRSNITTMLVLVTIFMTFASFRLYQKGENHREFHRIVQPAVGEKRVPVIDKILEDETLVTKGTI